MNTDDEWDDEERPAEEPPGLRDEYENSKIALPDARTIEYWTAYMD